MKQSLTIQAQVKDGTPDLSPDQVQRWASFLAKQEGKWVSLTASVKGKPRSLNQNRYYWKFIVGSIADYTGHSPEETHRALKEMFLPKQFITMGSREVEIEKTTTENDTEEQEAYHERCRAFAAAELGVRIPLPNEAPIE